MDSMEFNKIFGAVLTAGIAFVGLGVVSDDLVHPKHLAHSALDIKGADAPAASAAPAAEPAIPPIAPLLVKANIADGEALTKKVCIACHNFNAGGANKVGPLLYGVVGRMQASAPGYAYSAALKGHTGKWTYAELNKWLIKPSAYAPGTKMAYAGIGNDQIRADVIDYLHTLSTSPEPLPTQAEADAEAKSASAATPAAAPPSAAPGLPPLTPLLASADPARGQALTKKICIACHNFNEGGANKVGPLLYGVVGRQQASAPGYTYSAALKGHTGIWTFEELNKWLDKPSAYAPGTKMAYAGISNDQTRADVIDYLHTLAHDPLTLPTSGGAGAKPPAPHETAPAPAGAASPQATPLPSTDSHSPPKQN
jgi:cytochrome c